jgi:hypothetical protein
MVLGLGGALATTGAVVAEVALTKGSAGQACMSADLGIVPGHITMDNGQELALLGQSAKVVVRKVKSPKAEPFEIRSKFGLYPLEWSTSTGMTVWDWETDLPALDVIEASGQTFLAQGISTAPGKDPVSVAMEITIGERDVFLRTNMLPRRGRSVRGHLVGDAFEFADRDHLVDQEGRLIVGVVVLDGRELDLHQVHQRPFVQRHLLLASPPWRRSSGSSPGPARRS